MPLRSRSASVAACLMACAALAGCGDSTEATTTTTGDDRLERRVLALEAAVTRWAAATTVRDAHASAEAVRNLIVGPAGPLYGDGDRDGRTAGAVDVGVLPGLEGETGLTSGSQNPCIERDVLGGSWADPQARWAELQRRIARWTPQDNTFPALPSHPQRSVGWATLALGTDDLPRIAEYSGHAALHIQVLRDALDCAFAPPR